MDIESIAGDIVIELDYLLRRLHGSMILDWNYQAVKAKVVEVLESRLTPAQPDHKSSGGLALAVRPPKEHYEYVNSF